MAENIPVTLTLGTNDRLGDEDGKNDSEGAKLSLGIDENDGFSESEGAALVDGMDDRLGLPDTDGTSDMVGDCVGGLATHSPLVSQ